MRIVKLACVGAFIVILSGCNGFSSKTTEEPSSAEAVKNEADAVDTTQQHNDEDSIGAFHPLLIDQEVVSANGESKSYFTYAGSVPLKISLFNTGTESFLYEIRSVDKETTVTDGVLKSNESFEQVFEGLPEGDYVISCVIQEEEDPIDISLKVKVELIP